MLSGEGYEVCYVSINKLQLRPSSLPGCRLSPLQRGSTATSRHPPACSGRVSRMEGFLARRLHSHFMPTTCVQQQGRQDLRVSCGSLIDHKSEISIWARRAVWAI
eukprot:scaffold41527_cov23-Tisochrysis_lutea.AAC.1